MTEWVDLDDGDYIVNVSGYGSTLGYLVGSVVLDTKRGYRFEFVGKKQCKFSEWFQWEARAGNEIIDVTFADGSCTGIEERSLLTSSGVWASPSTAVVLPTDRASIQSGSR